MRTLSEPGWDGPANLMTAVRTAVHPDARGKKLGEEMLVHLLDEAIEFGASWITLEVRETNETEIMASVVHWVEPMEAGIELLAEAFGNVHVVGVPGNHGRNARKPRAKGRATDNFDWPLYKLMQRDYRKREDVTVQVGNAADAHVTIVDVPPFIGSVGRTSAGKGGHALLKRGLSWQATRQTQ